ncbi:MAG: archaeal flagellar protein FlaJ [Thermoplasmata archaeon]|nr:archaeal flagellar protein FlaJ [Thermoplasmata archaeon]
MKAKPKPEPRDGTPPPTEATRVFLRWFGGLAGKHLAKHPQLGVKLLKARNPLVPRAYLAATYGHMATAFAGGLVPLLLYALVSGGRMDVRLAVPFAALPFLLAIMVYSFDLLRPDLEITSRKRNLEQSLPYALNFMASMAAAGVVAVEIFGSLAQQKVYGEVAKEAAWIYRDVRLFSKDLVTVLQEAARRSPSQQFEEFLQGSVNTITSGGDLKLYLLAKSEQFTQENRRKQKAFLESLGVMAESYVVVAAAAPLFLIVILSVMGLLSKGVDPTLMLNVLILVALPTIHASFSFVLRSLRPD